MSYIVFAAGLCVHVFKDKEINYYHIFEIDVQNKASQFQIWKIALIIFFIQNFVFSLTLI